MEFQQSPKWISTNENPNTASSKGLSIIGGSSAITINNTIYLYGFGRFKTALADKNITSNLWSISSNEIITNTPLTPLATSIVPSNWDKNARNDTQQILDSDVSQPYLPYSLGVAINNLDRIAIFAATVSEQRVESTLNESNSSSISVQLSVFQFNVRTRNGWSKVESISTDKPLYRKEHSVTLSSLNSDNVYIFGGKNTTNPQNDFWIYSLSSSIWKNLAIPNNVKSRCGHTASMLSDGKMVIIGGYDCTVNNLVAFQGVKQTSLQLFDMNDVAVFDTVQSIWKNPPEIKGNIPKARTFHSAIVSGQNDVQAPYHTYLGSQKSQLEDITAILDTDTWTWRVPKPSIYQPFPQSHASISLVNATKVVFGFGINYQTVYDNFHIFDLSKEMWEPPSTARGLGEKALVNSIFNKNGGLRSAVIWIAIGCILSTFILLYIVAIWTFGLKRFHAKVVQFYKGLKKEVWQPRVGEPGWAESARLLLKTLFLMLFIYLIFTLTNQVLNSPIIDQLSYESDEQMLVDVPDVKFCFENLQDASEIVIRCSTDFGAQCSEFLYQLPTQANTDGTNTACSLFRAPPLFSLGQLSKRSFNSRGSLLKFDYYNLSNNKTAAISDNKQQVKIELYNKLHDPNLEIYKATLNQSITNATTLLFQWDSIEEENMYRSEYDLAGQASKNAYRLSTQLMSTISFELIKRISLKTSVWNYIGIAPSVTTHYEIETMTASESFTMEYNPLASSAQPFGSLRVFPYNYQTKVLREQKAFAFINAIGIFGGLFGLLFSLQTCLFGYRPRSPWGYMHRWSFGQFRLSLLNGLHTNFFPSTMKAFSTHLPLVQQSFARPIQHQASDFSISSSINATQNTNINTEHFDQTKHTPSTSKHGLYPLIIPADAKNNKNCLLSPSPIVDFSEMKGKRGSELRMALIEERIYTLERLFQAYYIDDEIFRSLDRALQADRRRAALSNTLDLLPTAGNRQDSSNLTLEKRRSMKKDDP
ncbi:hypothetical protein [Parasitella parasitica]|uniref:Galactose oxidase n=1 Tax=Parasitella parasitica TaxID=35722 RepID=A0A0B7NB69_9FUNG|nr:hypothetical protein [Parasitella parasitica]